MCDENNPVSLNIISIKDIQNLLEYFSKNTYRPTETDPIEREAMQRCIALMKTDYQLFVIHNQGGELSGHYPSQLIILEYENDNNFCTNAQPNVAPQSSQRLTNTIYESIYDSTKLRDLITKARFARCRARFAVPVILYKGKYICRSSTLSGGPEIYGRSGLDYFYGRSDVIPDNNMDTEEEQDNTTPQSDWQLFDRVRSQDIKLLKTYNVGTIVDFMVEKKKVKFGMNVTSSEKVDKENRYADFNIISLPYPGCEFFKHYKANNYLAENLVFDWTQAHVDANINVPVDSVTAQLQIKWDRYKSWDLVKITQNYMKLLLKYMQENSSGLLIHCISGWDRTPLFVSLLRLSLWADGIAHQNLDAQQILYLTIAYDWMLFGHHLVERLGKGEEILFFCFYMLKHLTSDEFSICGRHKSKYENRDKPEKGEKTVIRTDSDSQLDGIMLEKDLRGSNLSLNSCSSSISSKSQDTPSWVQFHDEPNGNEAFLIEPGTSLARSPVGRRTSPVTVPVATRIRQRQESSSSTSIGSWQMITGTGSVRGSDPAAECNGINANIGSQDSNVTLIDEESTYYPLDCVSRKKRLITLRELFYTSYSNAVGFKGSSDDSSLGAMFGNIAEKVGFSVL